MKRKTFLFNLFIFLLSITLPACSPSLPKGKCSSGICVDIRLVEPISIKDFVQVTIQVESEKDLRGAKVGLTFSDPRFTVDGEREWTVDLKAKTSVEFSSRFHFPEGEGSYYIYGSIFDPQIGGGPRDYENVHITIAGATINPPRISTPAGPEPAYPLTPTIESNPTDQSTNLNIVSNVVGDGYQIAYQGFEGNYSHILSIIPMKVSI